MTAFEIGSIIVNVISASLLALSIFWSSLSIKRSTALNVRSEAASKRADVIMHCNERYDAIYQSRIEFQTSNSTDTELIKIYHGRYWGLQSDQFDYWLNELVDIETFRSWWFNIAMKQRRPAGNLMLGGLTIKQSWETHGKPEHQYTNQWFSQFVDAMLEIAAKDGAHISPSAQIDRYLASILPVIEPYRKAQQGSLTLDVLVSDLQKALPPPT